MPEINETEQVLADEVTQVLELETSLATMQDELAKNPEFQAFLIKQKETQQQIADFWKRVEGEMIKHDIKSIKGEWGSLTIAERINWTYTDELPAKFYKKVVDTKRLTDTFRLEGKEPKGAAANYTKYLTKRIKGRETT
jgi:VCBS repeat-containing protein